MPSNLNEELDNLKSRNRELEYSLHLSNLSDDKTFRITLVQELQLTRQALIELNENVKKIGQTLVRKFSEDDESSEEEQPKEDYSKLEFEKPVKKLPKLPPRPKMKRQEPEDFDDEDSDEDTDDTDSEDSDDD